MLQARKAFSKTIYLQFFLLLLSSLSFSLVAEHCSQCQADNENFKLSLLNLVFKVSVKFVTVNVLLCILIM